MTTKKRKPKFRAGQVVMDKEYDPPRPRVIESVHPDVGGVVYVCDPVDSEGYGRAEETRLRPLTRKEAGR